MATEFNIDILEVDDKSSIDLSRFSHRAYVMPGEYTLSLHINDYTVKDIDVAFYERADKKTESDKFAPVEACLSPEQLPLVGLKPEAAAKVTWWHEGQCADFSALSGMTLVGDLSETRLLVSVPQAWLEYHDPFWLPSSRWEDGIAGAVFDYNLNASINKLNQGGVSENVSANGTTGANLGAWRLRADWQSRYHNAAGSPQRSRPSLEWNRIYAYRALRALSAKLTLGEDYLISGLFDAWRYSGISLRSDESMLPPRLRGYAPEVTGIAKTNAKVIISQQGRVIHQTTVASGPFRIQDLSDAVNGKLDVRVEEQDGSVQRFQVDTATVPYLTRAGQVRYKMALGKPTDYTHRAQGPEFATGEFSWGVSNTWSLYGGLIAAGHYHALAVGLGRDLFQFGALSADVTRAVARLPTERTRQGKSWRLSYSKRFDDINSDITFAGYRFSERDYLSMNEYLKARTYGGEPGQDKELYTVSASKSFSSARMSAYISYSQQKYWNRDKSERFSLSASRYFDLGHWRDVSVTISATRSDYYGRRDDAGYLSLSLPLGNGAMSYNGAMYNNSYTQNASWYQRLENNDNYRLQAGTRSGNGETLATSASGYYNHAGETMDMTANIAWEQNHYSSAGLSLSGGLTATPRGMAFHPGGINGGTRMLVSTRGVEGVPIDRNEYTNRFGIAVVPGVASYFRTTTAIDVNRLPDDVEAAGSSVVEAALTEGAIGFREFDVLKGAKVIAILTMADGSHPPFGASVRNGNGSEAGIVSESGLAWLSGINPSDTLTVTWGEAKRCQAQLPPAIPSEKILLPCQ